MSENLMLRLQSFQFDPPGVALTFADRLGRENGWTPEFTLRVIAEYKRFVYLAVEAGHPVTPSPAVDEVWHLHLCYTCSYWNELCQKIIGRPLHHGPTEGGEFEAAKFKNWYGNTLASYRQYFAEEPPNDIWPVVGGSNLPVNRAKDFWKIPKRPVKRAGVIAGLAAGVFLLAGCASAIDGIGSNFFAFAIIIVILTIIVAGIKKGGGGGRGGNGSGCGGSVGHSGCGSTSSHHDGGSHGCDGDSGGGSSCGGGCGGGD